MLYQSCASKFGYKGPIFSFLDIQYAETPTKEDYPDANAVYLHREAKFEMRTASTFSEHIVIKVLRAGGKKHANIKIPFWKDCEVLDLRARTTKPNGEVINLDKADFFEVTDFPEYILYADRKAKVFTFPSVDEGCILEYIYTLGYRGPFVPPWYFQGDEPTYLARFTFDVPKFLLFDYYISSLSGHEIERKVLEKDYRRRAVFTARNLPAIKHEPLSPPKNDISSWIVMSCASFYHFFFGEIWSGQETWYGIGKNYFHITDSIVQPPPTIVAKTAKIIAGCDNDEEKIKRIHKYIQENCRYVAVEIEGHRIVPHYPEEVLKNQYGDCKDLSGLLISMLRAADIEAYPVLTKTRSAGRFVESYPSVGQIDHVMVAIAFKHFEDEALVKNAIAYGKISFSHEDDYVIVDPSVPTCPLGQLHSEIQGRHVILCAGYDSRLLVLPSCSFKDNVFSTKVCFNFDSGDYDGEIQMQIRGEDAMRLRYGFLHFTKSELDDFMQKYFVGFPLKISLDTYEIDGVDDLDSVLKVNMKFKKFSSLQTSENKIFVPVMFKTSKLFEEIYSFGEHFHDLEFEFPHLHSDIFRVVVPQSCVLASLPEKANVRSDWCDYTCSSYVSGDTVVVNRNIAVKKCSVSKVHFQEVREIAAKILESSHKIIILTKK